VVGSEEVVRWGVVSLCLGLLVDLGELVHLFGLGLWWVLRIVVGGQLVCKRREEVEKGYLRILE